MDPKALAREVQDMLVLFLENTDIKVFHMHNCQYIITDLTGTNLLQLIWYIKDDSNIKILLNSLLESSMIALIKLRNSNNLDSRLGKAISIEITI